MIWAVVITIMFAVPCALAGYVVFWACREYRKIADANRNIDEARDATDRLITQMEETVDAIQVTYKDALSLLAVIAQGPTLPARTYQQLARQFFDEHEVKAQVTVVEHEQSKAVH